MATDRLDWGMLEGGRAAGHGPDEGQVIVGFLDKLLGREPREQYPQGSAAQYGQHGQDEQQGQYGQQGQYDPRGHYGQVPSGAGGGPATVSDDERAVARYRYLLRTAPPESLEQVHAEAFAKLTPEQRQQVLDELSKDAPAGEAPRSAQPQDLARAATRAEMRQPGTLERTFGRGGFGGGMGGPIMGSMMGTIAGVVVGSAIANALFADYGSSPEAAEAGEAGADVGGEGAAEGADAGDAGDVGDPGTDTGGDAWGGDAGGGDFGGSDFGGSDFGGGDFGGGDFGGGF